MPESTSHPSAEQGGNSLNLPLEPAEPEATAFSLAQRIDALVEFLPRFEADGASAGEWTPVEVRDGCCTMPSFDLSPELSGFMQALYRYGWVAKFDWSGWQDEAARLVNSPEALRTADIETIQKLLTAHARKERFCEGHLAGMFKCGHLAAILRRLKDIRGLAGSEYETQDDGLSNGGCGRVGDDRADSGDRTMNNAMLGRLEPVDLREVWQNEAGDFTPWLAREDNLTILANTLGLDLECQAQEQSVGPFRADIVCKELSSDSLVLIENQLNKTDHTHLGQLMTYAAGLDAVTIVWIAARFTEEHRAALDWLNEITGDKISFFGLEIELWRIGDSPVAPKFNIVSKPNDWTKGGGHGGGGGGGGTTKTQQLEHEYWLAFRDMLAERGSNLKAQRAAPCHYLKVPIGRSCFHMAALVNTQDKRIGIELVLGGPDAKKQFKRLESQKAEIEAAFGQPLEWRELPERQVCRVMCFKQDGDIADRSAWPKLHEWHADMLERMDRTFRTRVRALPAGDSDDAEEAN